MPPLRYFKLPAIVAIVMALLLVGCGKKGPLYLPDKAPTADHKQSKS